MNRLLKIPIPFFLQLCFLQGGCKKHKPPSSEWVTVNGQSFGCRVNAVPFIPEKRNKKVPPVRINFLYSPALRKFDLHLIAEKQNGSVEIWVNNPVVPGIKELKFRTRSYPTFNQPLNYGLYQHISSGKEYITNELTGGYIHILFLDAQNQKIEARFEFTGTEWHTGENIVITHGYFKNF